MVVVVSVRRTNPSGKSRVAAGLLEWLVPIVDSLRTVDQSLKNKTKAGRLLKYEPEPKYKFMYASG